LGFGGPNVAAIRVRIAASVQITPRRVLSPFNYACSSASLYFAHPIDQLFRAAMASPGLLMDKEVSYIPQTAVTICTNPKLIIAVDPQRR
jgi:hypothetical protein